MKRNWIKVLLTVSVVALLVTPFSAGQGEAEAKTLKVGVLFPMSGPGGLWGIPWHNATDLLAEEYNDAGGIKVGNDRYDLKIIHEDTKYKPDVARTAAEKLIYRDGAKFILGTMGGGSMSAIIPLCNENKIITICNSNAIDIIGPDRPYNFRAYIGIGELGYAYLEWIRDNLGVKSMALAMWDTETGISINKDLQIACAELGLKYSIEWFTLGTQDFYPIMTKTLTKKPDYIFAGAGPGDAGLMLKVLKELKYKGYRGTMTPTSASTLLKVASKEEIEGYITTTFIVEGPLADKNILDFKARYEKKYGEWHGFAVDGSAFLSILVQGLEAAGSLDADKVKATLEGMDFIEHPCLGKCPWGGLERYGINHTILTPLHITQIKDGKDVGLAIIPPDKMKTIKRPD